MTEGKDYLGEKLRLAERARENEYFRRIDQELIDRMRQRDHAEAAEATAAVPVQQMYTPILVPVDFSSYSTKALLCAADIAERFDASIIVLHVIAREVGMHAVRQRLGHTGLPLLGPFTSPPSQDIPPEEMESVIVNYREQAYTQLQDFLPPRLAQRSVELRVVVGQPFERIIEMALHDKAGLIVLGTHGRTGLAHMALGSVAERVVRLAPCAVLTVKESTPESDSWLRDFYARFMPPA